MSDPNQGDLPAALLRSAMRIRGEVARIRRFHAAVGNHSDLPAEVDEALRVVARWAGRVAASSEPGIVSPVAKEIGPAPVEPGPLAARPRLRQANRRTRR